MVKKGDIIIMVLTTTDGTLIYGRGTNYHVGKVGESILLQWCEDGLWNHTFMPIDSVKEGLMSGLIHIVGRKDKLPIKFIRPHAFNPQLIDNPPINKKPSPYYTPQLYQWGLTYE